MQIFSFLSHGMRSITKRGFFGFCLIFITAIYKVWVFLCFAHFPGSELDAAQSEAGCVVKFPEWPTKEQQSKSVPVPQQSCQQLQGQPGRSLRKQ